MHSPEKIFSSFFGPFCSFQWEISVKAHIYWHLSQKSTPFVKKVRKTNKKRLIIEFKKLERNYYINSNEKRKENKGKELIKTK